jgi:hypothetical protein
VTWVSGIMPRHGLFLVTSLLGTVGQVHGEVEERCRDTVDDQSIQVHAKIH